MSTRAVRDPSQALAIDQYPREKPLSSVGYANFSPFKYLSLFRALFIRDLKSQYRRSSLGILWAVLQPLLLLAMFLLLRGIVDLPSEGLPYPVFALCALLPWTFFVNGVTRAGPSVVNNAGIVKKIGIAREIFPLVAVFLSLLDFLVAGFFLAVVLVWYKIPVTIAYLWLPILLLILFVTAFASGLLIASIGTFRRDILLAIPFLFQFGLLATPIMYPMSSVPAGWHSLYKLNPLVGLIEGFRQVIGHGNVPDLSALAVSAVAALFLLVLALPIFRSASRYFADIL